MFWAEIRKIMYTPEFYYIKVGFKGGQSYIGVFSWCGANLINAGKAIRKILKWKCFITKHMRCQFEHLIRYLSFKETNKNFILIRMCCPYLLDSVFADKHICKHVAKYSSLCYLFSTCIITSTFAYLIRWLWRRLLIKFNFCDSIF